MGYEKIEEPQNYPELAIYAIWRASGIRYILTANVSPTVHGSHRFPANGGRESVHVATTETKQTLTTPPVPSLASSDFSPHERAVAAKADMFSASPFSEVYHQWQCWEWGLHG